MTQMGGETTRTVGTADSRERLKKLRKGSLKLLSVKQLQSYLELLYLVAVSG